METKRKRVRREQDELSKDKPVTHQKSRLPPYGKKWLEVRPSSGVVIAIGPHAWDLAKDRPNRMMVLPEGTSPFEFIWPCDGKGALIHETGPCDDPMLETMARVLIEGGQPFVVALRQSLLDTPGADPRVFFDRRVVRAA